MFSIRFSSSCTASSAESISDAGSHSPASSDHNVEVSLRAGYLHKRHLPRILAGFPSPHSTTIGMAAQVLYLKSLHARQQFPAFGAAA
jgi:hypothetical protein